ncbi:MAG: alpha/beta fold hydrolase [Betaproteobacteria bacterium]|nr:alpha/beta fold hydrolase [Betaproteobacteria bacterium]
MTKIEILAHDGRVLAGFRFDPSASFPFPKATVVIAPAMAVPQAFYAAFAQYLASCGYTVWTFDYRGTGESHQGSLRGAKGDLTDWVARDFDAVLTHANDLLPEAPLFAIGHSFGGQCAPLLPSRDRLSGLINIAVGSGSRRHTTPSTQRAAPLLWHVLVPLLCPLFGYFPGAKIGVIGNVPTGAMRQWRRWCLTEEYILTGEPGAREAYASAQYAVLALTFADDELLLEEGSLMLHRAYKQRPVDYRLIEASRVGMARIGHFGFFKPQSAEKLWPMVSQWLEERRHEPRPGMARY